MHRKMNKLFSFGNLIFLFLIYFSLYTAIGSFHKHKEENLHFHAENILTKDHTVAVNTDCTLCPAIFSISFFNLESTTRFLIYNLSFLKIEIKQNSLLGFKEFKHKLGRAPPKI